MKTLLLITLLILSGCASRMPCATYTQKSAKHYEQASKKINPGYLCVPRKKYYQ